MAGRDGGKALQILIGRWAELVGNLRKMKMAAVAKPTDGWAVFKISEEEAGLVKLELHPVVFNVPERATHTSTDLYVVARGHLHVNLIATQTEERLRTQWFSTEVAYFRSRRNGLEHVFGAHFDFALSEVGHPIFHVQVKSFAEFSQYVRQQFAVGPEDVDAIQKILKTVRLPSAQMDVFSFFLQICADHLIDGTSTEEELAAFRDVVRRGSFIQGAAHLAPRLASEDARTCYRAKHWYP